MTDRAEAGPEHGQNSNQLDVRRATLAETDRAIASPGLTDFPTYDELPPALLSSLRSLINRYELHARDNMPSPLAVTSPSPGADTALVSKALARVLAHEHGNYVLWMGSDWLDDAEGADAPNSHGKALLDVLANQTSIRTILNVDPQHPNLTQLATGPIPGGRGHMIARSPEFQELLTLFAQEFHTVIIDAPPLLGAGDGLALLPRTAGYVLVVRHRSVSSREVRQATELASPTPNVGVVMTEYATRVPRIVRRVLGA